jgi:hypothetical protein
LEIVGEVKIDMPGPREKRLRDPSYFNLVEGCGSSRKSKVATETESPSLKIK